ncbi:MAG: translation initiation factor IF-2 [Pirellulales bacterium]
MAVRIYALAKELDLDSKDLVDICTRAGIPGKGSALASLTEEEVVRVQDYIKGGSAKAKKPGGGGEAAVMERPRDPVRAARMPVIVTPKPLAPTLRRRERMESDSPSTAVAEQLPPLSEEEPAELVKPARPVLSPAAASAAATTRDTAPGSAPLSRIVRREDYIGPGSAAGKPPVLGTGSSDRGSKAKRSGDSAAPKARPNVKLAPLPPPSKTPLRKAKDEAPAQKPDMKLPAEVLGAGKLGSRPLADHLRRAERTLEDEKQRKTTRGPLTPETPAGGRGKVRGKSKVGGEAEEDKRPMLGGREQRQASRRRTNPQRGDEDGMGTRRITRKPRKSGTSTAAPRKDRITIQLPCSVRDLSEAAGVPAAQILRILMSEGVMTNITGLMAPDMTEFVASELGINVDFVQPQSLEDQVLSQIREQDDDLANLVSRPPVITFLGHVDHGKTSLLDRIIGTNVVSGESGGITQHIRAYQIEKDGRLISFVDTPGHEAFTEMRARGANVTDIAVLVVAGDDGVMPQTEEAISHARAAEVPIVVALNKIDLPGIDLNRVYQGLNSNGLLPSEWGGDVEVVKTSATTGVGLDELLETLLTVAELHEYKANPNRAALGTCLEAQQEAGKGIVVKVIVENGTLRVGDVIVCGQAHGRVKAMFDTLEVDKRVEEAGPSRPVNLIGLDLAPAAGEHFYVLDDIAQAREIAEERAQLERAQALGDTGFRHVTLETLFDRLEGSGEVQTLNLILRADVRGSIEAIQKEFTKLEHPEVRLKILQATVGGVSVADVHLAHASDAIIIGFNVVPDENARSLADRVGVQIRRYEVIYKITDDLKLALEGMLKPEEREVELGRALVQQIFKISRLGTVAGCRVLGGTIERNARARVIRDSTVIGDYPLDTLRREKDDAKEVREGLECGIKLSGYNDVKEGDILEVYRVEEVGRSFDT